MCEREQHTVVISPSSSDKYIPVMSPDALSNTSGFSNVKNAVPDVPSLDLVSFTSGTDVSTESRTKEIVAAFEIANDFLRPLLLLKLLLTKGDDCFAPFRKGARVVVEDRRPQREDKVDIFFSLSARRRYEERLVWSFCSHGGGEETEAE